MFMYTSHVVYMLYNCTLITQATKANFVIYFKFELISESQLVGTFSALDR